MSRAEAKQNLIGFGIVEPTEEQITNYLNQIGAETKKEKEKAESLKAKADKADELQTELDRINNEKLSDVEKANKALKALETANNRIAELERMQKITAQRNSVVEKFKVTGEQANQIVKDDGSLDYDVLGQIISDKEKAAATAKEKEIANGATNPGGGSAGGDDVKTNAEKIASKFFGNQKQENNILSHYLSGGK